MSLRSTLRFLAGVLITVIVFSGLTAIAATNTVPPTRADAQALVIGLNNIRPAACATIYVTNLVTGSGTLTGTPGNDLILGNSSSDNIDGMGGDDCIVGGGGDDMITGAEGNDICLGGPGDDTLVDCEGEIQ